MNGSDIDSSDEAFKPGQVRKARAAGLGFWEKYMDRPGPKGIHRVYDFKFDEKLSSHVGLHVHVLLLEKPKKIRKEG